MSLPSRGGPLAGLRVVELDAVGPVPHAGMLLADLGAEVLLIRRPGVDLGGKLLSDRSHHIVELDLKFAANHGVARRLLARADILLEGFRPGVLERLDLGPDGLLADNPRLIIGRMTGWGQDGPLAHSAGHDINYISLTGALAAIGPADGDPLPPLNLVGDFGGGALYLVVGVLAALHERGRSGRGQVIDAAMVDGASHLMAMFWAMRELGMLAPRRGANMLDGGAPYYRTYRCACGGHVAIGAIEPQFWAIVVDRLGLDPQLAARRDDPAAWPALREAIAARIATRNRAEWEALFTGTDACFSPVLGLDEVAQYPHVAARGTIVSPGGIPQPAPAPRFSRSAAPPVALPERLDAAVALGRWGA